MVVGKLSRLPCRLNPKPQRPAAHGCLQQIAANRLSSPQGVIAIMLQGFFRPAAENAVKYLVHALDLIALLD
jgi:hypothetical protein